MVTMIKSLTANSEVDMEVGVVEYSDHPPQDTKLVVVHQLKTSDQAQKQINAITLASGGDAPEAVFDGVVAACEKIQWREHSRRVVVLVGDAPPHGVGAYGDGFPRGCPCGHTIESTSAVAEGVGITVYAVALAKDPFVYFEKIARLTGGIAVESGQGDAAIAKIQEVLKGEFGNLELDRKVLDAWNDGATVDSVAAQLSVKPVDVAASHARLSRRSLLNTKELVAV
jgi:hypothetical protein